MNQIRPLLGGTLPQNGVLKSWFGQRVSGDLVTLDNAIGWPNKIMRNSSMSTGTDIFATARFRSLNQPRQQICLVVGFRLWQTNTHSTVLLFCQKEEWGLCEYVIVHTIWGGKPVILWISLGGKPKWLPLKFGYHDVMHTSPIVTSSMCGIFAVLLNPTNLEDTWRRSD